MRASSGDPIGIQRLLKTEDDAAVRFKAFSMSKVCLKAIEMPVFMLDKGEIFLAVNATHVCI